MKFFKIALFLVFFLFLTSPFLQREMSRSDRGIFALNLPKYSGRVNDFANIFSVDFKNNLEQKLTKIETDTTNQIAVVTVSDLQGTTIEDYAEQLFQSWGIGQKDKDNGILLLVALKERQVRIEVGYGLEPVITDGRAGEIIRNQITPEFKKGNYEQGVQNGIDKISQYLTGEITSDSPSNQIDDINVKYIIYILVFFLGFFSYALAYMARTTSFYAGGIGGAILGFIVGILSSMVVAITLALIIGLIGLFLDFILSKNYIRLKKLGRNTGFWSSRGGFGGGGGGFGGFGGGSSGGGGASGSW